MTGGPDETRDAQLERALIGGRERRPIVIVDYDERWPARYEAERAAIAAALGASARRIEHVGSTSVPGLAAKPIVDIVVAVPDVDDEAAYVPQLEAAGYVLRVREPGHRMFRTPALDVHVHIHAVGDPEFQRLVTFRDRLRRDASDRARYDATKRDLARRDWRDMNDYADAKTDVVEEILRRAADDQA
jgi:GrpB-like predicted nucleotidyltransferase (UPF0157 family)